MNVKYISKTELRRIIKIVLFFEKNLFIRTYRSLICNIYILQKMSKSKAGSKHYTVVEKKFLVEILKKYKDIIETKKSDSSTLKEKDAAWNKITEEFNMSNSIIQERSAQQLKKLWANMKATQRNILTKQRQTMLTTGGGPEEKIPEIDSDIAFIVPNLMEMAPTQFTSDLSEDDICRQRQIIRENLDKLCHENENKKTIEEEESILHVNKFIDSIEFDEDVIVENYIIEDVNKDVTEKCSTITRSLLEDSDIIKRRKQCVSEADEPILERDSLKTAQQSKNVSKPSVASKRKRGETRSTNISCKSVEINPIDEELQMERFKRIMSEEKKIAELKLQREKNLVDHELLVQTFVVQHMKRIQELEYREAKAKADLNEMLLQAEIKKISK